ncbi:MAG: hypothetical protein EXS13_10165 [Planctomycetes bacterium]|nr:hypothetical protein [Planctomycetota bacterium]
MPGAVERAGGRGGPPCLRSSVRGGRCRRSRPSRARRRRSRARRRKKRRPPIRATSCSRRA